MHFLMNNLNKYIPFKVCKYSYPYFTDGKRKAVVGLPFIYVHIGSGSLSAKYRTVPSSKHKLEHF